LVELVACEEAKTQMRFAQVQFAIDEEERADQIIDLLLDKRLVACGQRLGPIVSRYWWRGSLEQAAEWLVLLKTRFDLIAAVTAAIVESHPYETPEVIALEIVDGAPAYLQWIGEITTPQEP
jgi:periplasmic divalent cation tolerance protein